MSAPSGTRRRQRDRDLWRDAFGRVAVRSAQTLIVLALVVVVVFAAVRIRLLVVPLLIAVLVAAAASPLVGRLQRLGLPRTLAVLVTLLTGIGVLGGLGWLVGSAVREQWDDLVAGAREGFQELQRYITDGPLGLTQEQLDSAWQAVRDALSGAQVQAGAVSGATLVAEVVAGIFLGAVLLYFLLRDGDRIWTFARQFLPNDDDERYDLAARRSVDVLGGYIRGTAIIAAVDAVLIGVALAIIGVPLALPLAVVVFLGAFVPLVGATVAGAVAALIALVSNGPVPALIVVAVVIVVNQVEGDVLAPVVLGRSLSLHPLAILVALTAGTIVAGIIGAVLAVPFTALGWAVVKIWRGEDDEQSQQPPPDTSQPSADEGRSAPSEREAVLEGGRADAGPPTRTPSEQTGPEQTGRPPQEGTAT